MELAEIRKDRRFLRLRLDRDAAGGRQLHGDAEQPQRVTDARTGQAERLQSGMARVDAHGKPNRSAKLQRLDALFAADGVLHAQLQAAKAHGQRGLMPRQQPVLRLLAAEAARGQLRRIGRSHHGGQAERQRKDGQQHREQQQEKREPARIKAVKNNADQQKQPVNDPVFCHRLIISAQGPAAGSLRGSAARRPAGRRPPARGADGARWSAGRSPECPSERHSPASARRRRPWPST